MKLSQASGYIALLFAQFGWGFAALYWQHFSMIPTMDLMVYRVVFSFLWLIAFALILNMRSFIQAITAASMKVLMIYGLAAVLVAVNWAAFIYSSTRGLGVEPSLGYFLVSLANIGVARLIFKEKLSRLKGVAVGCGIVAGVIVALSADQLQVWIPGVIVISIVIYSYIKKIGKLSATIGMQIETIALCAIFMVFSGFESFAQFNNYFDYPSLIIWLLPLSGLVSLGPLLLFSYAAKHVPMMTLGWANYLSPSLQLLVGVWVFNNELSPAILSAYICIWFGLLLVIYDNWKQVR